MINDTHLATLQAMGITLYTPREHTISFDSQRVDITQDVSKQAISAQTGHASAIQSTAKRASASSAAHIDQIKSLLKGKQANTSNDELPPEKVKSGEASAHLAPAAATSDVSANTSVAEHAQVASRRNAQTTTMQTPSVSESPVMAQTAYLKDAVSARWLQDFTLCLPEQYREHILLSTQVDHAAVINEQLVLPEPLIRPSPQNKLLFQQILALYAQGERN